MKYTITNAITNALTKIERARGFLEGAKLSDEWIQRMQENAFVLEAHHTTHIEGTQLTLDQSEKLLAGQKVPEANPEDVQELLNYRKAFNLVAEGHAITEGVIREIHKRLVENVRGNSAAPGEYRKVQNYVVNSKTQEVIYTPPAAYEVPIMMAKLTEWLNQETDVHPVLMAGIAQFEFVHIHPFLDGNGRTARLLSTLCLYQAGYDFKRLFTISEYYDRDRPAYYKAIQSVRENDMDMTLWLEYFTKGLATQLREVEEKGEASIKLSQLQLTPRQQSILEFAMAQKKDFSSQEITAAYPDVTPRTLQRDLKDLVDKGLLTSAGETTSRRYRLGEI